MILLADHVHHETFECFPGQVLLAQEASMSERQVRLHLKKLESDGRIVRSSRYAGSGERTSDSYQLVGLQTWATGARASAKEIHERARQEELEKTTTGVNPPVVTTGGFTSDYRRVCVETTGVNPPGNLKREYQEEREEEEEPLTKAEAKLGEAEVVRFA
jgi:hypothetical protein